MHHVDHVAIKVESTFNFLSVYSNWWLVRTTYVVDGRFFAHLFWKVEGSCAHTRYSCVGVIRMWRGHSHVGVTHVWREGTFMCESYSCVDGGDIHMWELLMCGGDIHV